MLFNVLLHDAGRVADPNSLSIVIVAINELILIGDSKNSKFVASKSNKT